MKHNKLHDGEIALQKLTKVDPEIYDMVGRFFRPYLPDQHRLFYRNQPFLAFGSIDSDDRPWASIVVGKPGFATSPLPSLLQINTNIIPGDPLKLAIKNGSYIGIVGVELPTRRRNRVNGKIIEVVPAQQDIADNFLIKVDLSFGNCPKYIQTRSITIDEQKLSSLSHIAPPIVSNSMNEEQMSLVRQSDTFFVASSYVPNDTDPSSGVDVSHRGGKPGFAVVLDGTTIKWPDYVGNFIFNTLGNIHKNPKCGLVFPNFETGDVLQMTGEAFILFDDKSLPGAQRMVQFNIKEVRHTKAALPFKSQFLEYSPYSPEVEFGPGVNPVTGVKGYTLQCSHIRQETPDTKTYQLSGGIALTNNQVPGQYATFDIEINGQTYVRTWTISSAGSKSDYAIEITVKRKKGGIVSNWLFDNFTLGSEIKLTGIGGDFTLTNALANKQKLLMIAAGTGITPFMSMLQGIFAQQPTHDFKKLDIVLLYSNRTIEESIFLTELMTMTAVSEGHVKLLGVTTQEEVDWLLHGRINKKMIIEHVPDLLDRRVALCGPEEFMKHVLDQLTELSFPLADCLLENYNL